MKTDNLSITNIICLLCNYTIYKVTISFYQCKIELIILSYVLYMKEGFFRRAQSLKKQGYLVSPDFLICRNVLESLLATAREGLCHVFKNHFH